MNKNYIECICPDKDCEWYGKCKDCISLHRYHATIPECLKKEIYEQKRIVTNFINEK